MIGFLLAMGLQIAPLHAQSPGGDKGREPAKSTSIRLPMAPRVDTTDAEVKAVYQTWRSYLNAKPDSIYDNPYWSDRDQKRYHDFDLSRRWTYGYTISGRSVHKLYDLTPRVLSIEKRTNEYMIRTLWAPKDPEETDHLYSLQRVYARREDGQWKLHNALPVVTENWEQRTVGFIEYMYPPDFDFNEKKAKQAAAFVDSLRQKFDGFSRKQISYYVTPSYAEMTRLMGLDYAWDGNDGLVYPKNQQVFAGNGSEAYRHELVHALFPPEGDRHRLVDEGLATYLGGLGDHSPASVINDVAKAVANDPELTFDRILTGRRIPAKIFYGSGAVLCKMVREKGGTGALKALLASSRSASEVRHTVAELFDVEPEKVAKLWREYLYRYGSVDSG